MRKSSVRAQGRLPGGVAWGAELSVFAASLVQRMISSREAEGESRWLESGS